MNLSPPDPRAATHWPMLLRSRAVLTLLLVELLIAAAVAWGLWTMRRQRLDDELATLASLAAAMAAQADGTLDVADAALRATRAELGQGLLRPDSAEAHVLLRTRAAALPQFRSLVVVDAHGRRVATSRDESPPPASLSGRDFFVAAQGAASPELFVGSPAISRIDGRPVIDVSMDWRDASGRFAGALLLSADPAFLDGGFARIAPSPDTRLAIYRRDGARVSGAPGQAGPNGLPAPELDALWRDATLQRPRMLRLARGDERLIAAYPLQRFPLLVVMTRDAGAALADWVEQSWLVGSFAASALSVTLLLSLRNLREQALRRASQQALADEQARAVRAFDAAQEGHWEWTPGTQRSHLSPRMRALLGSDGVHQGDVPPKGSDAGFGPLAGAEVHEDDHAAVRAAFDAPAQGRSEPIDLTVRVRHADAQWHHVRLRGHALRDVDARATLLSGIASDISAEVEAGQLQRRLEDQLQRASKLEALGTLAGGVAHDFNNILAAIVGYGELAQGAAAPGSAQARQLEQVLRAGQRGKALVERILSFSRGAPRARSAFALQPLVDEVLQMLAASLPATVTLRRRLQAPQLAIAGDTTMVFEAVMNLCTNAVQAMPHGGLLCVELHALQLEGPLLLSEHSLAPGRYACLSIADSGEGIAPAVMARLFEPFFTTRGPQQGTGLGLAVVHGVMAEHGGAIDVRNRPEGGACFALYFPRVDAIVDAMPVPDGDDTEPVPGRGQTVMVVDDEPALVELAEEMLAGLGYEAIGFDSSTAALAAFTAAPERFDVVVSDELMPQLGGTALAVALHALRPQLPVVLASGYGGPQLQARAAQAGVAQCIAKPLRRAELARAVAQALASVAGGGEAGSRRFQP